MYFSLLSALILQGLALEQAVLPSGVFRDDILFDLSWPGPPDSAKELTEEIPLGLDSQKEEQVELVGRELGNFKEEEVEEESKSGLSDSLLPEDDYNELNYVDMRTGRDEEYRCVLPQILSWDADQAEEDADEEEHRPENLLKSLSTRCTKLISGYWIYELCHGSHMRQYHEPNKQATGTGEKEKLDEYYLGLVGKSSKTSKKDRSSSSLPGAGSEESETGLAETQEKAKDIPVWYYNGHDYPYYKVEMGGGTPCDLKEDMPRSVTIRYICDMNAHVTGTFLHIEEVTTCKYEAVIATTTLCQSKAYRLKENPVHPVKCFSKDGSPSKPNSLLEYEISMLQHLQSTKHKKSSNSKVLWDSDKTGEGGEEREGAGDYRNDLGGDPGQSHTQLDETFIRSFLSGEMCLRGGSGWWQHEVCYGKYVKQIHEEAGIDPVEVYLGHWMEESHKRWFSSAGYKRQSKNHVIHLYMNGDVCDMTGVARQCQVKFRCSKSARLSQISLFLEEPTTCNYVLTVEAAFLCPLLQDTDKNGLLNFLPVSTMVDEKEEGVDQEEGRFEYDEDGNVKDETLGGVGQNGELEWDQDNQEAEEEEEEESEIMSRARHL